MQIDKLNAEIGKELAPRTAHFVHATFNACLGAAVRDAAPDDAGEVLASRIIELMKITGMPNGLVALGFGESEIDALATGAEPQYRVIKNAPVDIGRDELKSLCRAALRYW